MHIVKSAHLVSSLATLTQICAIKACNAEELVPSLGMQFDGILKLCPENQFSGWVSSQDDRPSFFLNRGHMVALLKTLAPNSCLTFP